MSGRGVRIGEQDDIHKASMFESKRAPNQVEVCLARHSYAHHFAARVL
jgi:hypothetical protein